MTCNAVLSSVALELMIEDPLSLGVVCITEEMYNKSFFCGMRHVNTQ